jgi:integrase
LDNPKGYRPDIHCFLFGVLTVARSNEARLVDWGEIDLRKKVWRMPAGKYKSEKSWVIPLTREAIKILKAKPSAKYQEGRAFSTLDGGKIGDKKLSSMPKPWAMMLYLMDSDAPFALGARKRNLITKHQS